MEYKQTKIGLLPSNWKVESLKDIVSAPIVYGIVQAGPHIEDGMPYITSTDVTRRINPDLLQRASEDIAKKYRRSEVYPNDVVFSLRGNVGDTCIVPAELKKANLTQGTARIRANHKAIHHYLNSIFSSDILKKQIDAVAKGSTFKEISLDELRKLRVAIPPLPEQRAIAAILSTWEKGIEKLQQLITAKQKRKKALMQQLLTGKKRFKEFSDEWQEVKYGDILKQVKRPVVWNDEELYELISVRRRSGGLFHRESLYGHQILTKSLFTAKKGDFLISKMQILHGASGLTTEAFDGMKVSGSYISVVAKNPKQLDIEFFSWFAKLPYFYHQTYIASYGVHIEKMTFDFKTFLKLTTQLPPVEEQRKIVSVLNTSDKEIETLQQKLNALKQQKKGLMQKLLTGQVRVNVTAEPVS